MPGWAGSISRKLPGMLRPGRPLLLSLFLLVSGCGTLPFFDDMGHGEDYTLSLHVVSRHYPQRLWARHLCSLAFDAGHSRFLPLPRHSFCWDCGSILTSGAGGQRED